MQTNHQTAHPSLSSSLWAATLFIAVLWCIKSAEVLFGFSLHSLGVYPGEYSGLLGILTAPLIHGSYEHLTGNSMALFLLVSALFYGYPRSKLWVFAIVWLFSGMGTWIFARESFHFGASGLTHGLFFYLLTISILRRDKRSILLMMIAFFMYGGMVMTIFPREEHISFEYHFFGAVAGFICAFLFRRVDPTPVEKQYTWEKHPDIEDQVIGDEWRVNQDTVHSDNDDEISEVNNADDPRKRFH
ncbi:MAG: rhomboid family intramembrane serine protease [Aestuariibacter sp.]